MLFLSHTTFGDPASESHDALDSRFHGNDGKAECIFHERGLALEC
jgi:hypothetical protein